MMCQRTGVRRLHMALEALLIAVTLAKHLKFKGFKNFAGLGLEPLRRPDQLVRPEKPIGAEAL
jgi:hypothetical protein